MTLKFNYCIFIKISLKMKTLFVVVLFAFINSVSLSQSFYNDFEDDTLQGWKNTDDSTTLLTIEENSPNKYLQKECDGTNSAIGEMAIINRDENYWAGDYFYGMEGWEYMINIDEIFMKNDNDFDLHLRYGFTGANGYSLITTEPIIVPANSDWDMYEQYFYVEFPSIDNLTIINDTTGLTIFEIFDNIIAMFGEVVEFKIFHNEDISFEGEIVTGTLQIDEIFTYLLLSNEDNEITNTKIYPNPANNIINLKFPQAVKGCIDFFNVLGENVLSKKINSSNTQIDISELKSGVYLLSIQSENQSTVKKLVKI